MQIGLSSIIADGFGSTRFAIEGSSVTVSFPPYGTLIETLTNQQYPIAEGGLSLEIGGTYYATQTATVDRLADGAGGDFLDWDNVRDVAYYSNGTYITNASGSTYVDINGTNYVNGSYVTNYYHSGEGSFYSSSDYSYFIYGELITSSGSGSSSISTPAGSFTYETWDGINYYADGGSGYYLEYNNLASASYGDYIGNDGTSGSNSTEVPSYSNNYFSYETWTSQDYYYDGSGSYYTAKVDLVSASYGDFITNDGTYDYYWDGSGGYYY